MKIGQWSVGDSVRVKPGVKDEDFGLEMEGWQGRITEVDVKNDIVVIRWDAITLRNMPAEYIADSEEQGLGWDEYYLGPEDVELAEARDSEQETETTKAEIQTNFAWHHLGEEGRDIGHILAGIDPDDTSEQLERWEEYLSATLTFPFKAEVTEFQERGPMRGGDILVVHEIESIDENYGLIVQVKKGRKTYYFPLCDLTAVDEKSPNHLPVQLYAVWFANR
ncbi:MAG: hypothetical protein HY328_14205 [Chloroflexi bacterium]|nr:hypothetical protein [Chloroflexota bacterium]